MLETPLSRRSLLAGGAATLAGALVASPASAGATAATARAKGRCLPKNIVAQAPQLYPESFTYDPTRGKFLVGSALQGSVSIVDGDGKVTELVAPLGQVSTLGIQLDVKRGRGLVAFSDFWIRQRLPVDGPPVSEIAIFDLASGEVLKRIDIDPGATTPTFGNDLTLDAAGNAYVTNSVNPTIVKITPRGEFTRWFSDPRFEATTVGANGIAYHPDGFLLVSRYDTGLLYKIPLKHPERMAEVKLPDPIIGVDGMRLNSRGELVVVTNSIGEAIGVGGGVDGVTYLGSRDGWRTAKVRRQKQPWPVAGPTTVAFTPSGDYILSGKVAVLFAGGVANDFTIDRF